MEEIDNKDTAPAVKEKRFGWLSVVGIIVGVILLTSVLTAWWVKHNIYASKFTPTQLTSKEQQVLDAKLKKLEEAAHRDTVIQRREKVDEPNAPLKPEPYTEEGAVREISLTEKEVNALIAKEPDMARRVAVDLSENLVSVKVVMPMDQEIPVLGGKTLRLNLGVGLSYKEGQPVVALRGVSLGGIPLPNAWLGNLKHKNLVEEFGSEGGFWKLFAEGIDDIQVKEGHIRIKLKE
jgi:hypothetical protein